MGDPTTPAVEPVADVRVSPSSLTIAVGGGGSLAATTLDASGRTLSGRALSWLTSDADVATVDSSGQVTGVAEGVATISASSEGRTGSATVTVEGGEGDLRVSIQTIGGVDPDGYRVLLDGADVGGVTDGGTLPLSDLAAGSYTLTLSDISERCLPQAAQRDVETASVFTTSIGILDGQETATTIRMSCALDAASMDTLGLSLSEDDAALYAIEVPTNATRLEVQMSGENGDADLYLRAGAIPVLTPVGVDCFSEGFDTNESCVVELPQPGLWFAMVVAFTGFTDAELVVDIRASTGNVAAVEVAPEDQLLTVGDLAQLTATLRNGEGEAVTGFPIEWASSNDEIATVDENGRVTAVDVGSVEIFATADGVTGRAPLHVNVSPDPTGYDITLEFVTPVSAEDREVFETAAARWEEIITANLVNIDFTGAPRTSDRSCGGEFNEGIVDDVHIFVQLEFIDGPFDILGQAGPCIIRAASDLPISGRMIFDTADLDRLRADGRLSAVILHEMAHVLGLGSIWELRGLRSSDATCVPSGDPIFTGAFARAAFDSIGGAAYNGPRVPISNSGTVGDGSTCVHWRESVFGNELMTPTLDVGVDAPLSLLTIESLRDLGYEVDAGRADGYSLPTSALRSGPVPAGLHFGDDVLRPIGRLRPDGVFVPWRAPEWR